MTEDGTKPEQAESKEQFLKRMAAAGTKYLEQKERLTQAFNKTYDASNGKFAPAFDAYYNNNPEVKQLRKDQNRLAVELTAGEERILEQGDPKTLSQFVKELVGENPSDIAGSVVKALSFIPPDVARLVLRGEINKYIIGVFEGKPQRAEPGTEIVARLAAAHSANIVPDPVQVPPA